MDINEQVKKIIIESADLEGVAVSDIKDDMPLFGEDGLGLDSIDALELGIALKKKFGLSFSTVEDENKRFFYSTATLVEYINSQMK